MGERFVSERNLKFLLYEVFAVNALTRHGYYEEHSRETFDMVLDTALRISADTLRPVLQEMDRQQPEFVDGRVKVHPQVRKFMKECGAGGWIAASAPFELGGQQLPLMISEAARFIFSAANYSASVYPFLTAGAAHLLESFGTAEMQEKYLPRMYAGEWQGTMALTEPQAGSSLADITTLAEPTPGGHHMIRGQKIFISAGDHDGVDNIIHLMLARIRDAPPGVKGISLFVVPKYRMGKSQEPVFNDVNTAGIYHKLGYRGAPIVQLSFGENGDCRGYLVGEPHKGLRYMFQMMNESRIDVGFGATAVASAAYYAALDYTKERPQGRKLAEKNPAFPQVPIIEHPDVKRMLLFQRSVVEGSLSLLLQCCRYADYKRLLKGEEKRKNALLLDLLTPVAKSYPAEMGIRSVSQGLQCLGGYGYCDEFPLELYYRDARIHPIHEGTTGIQGLDLLGRKVTMEDGKAFHFYIEEVKKTIEAAEDLSYLKPQAHDLDNALQTLQETTAHLIRLASQGKLELFLADATLYLEFFGIISIAWQWLHQGIFAGKALDRGVSPGDADFYEGKLFTLRYFYAYELPRIEGLAKTLRECQGITVAMRENLFSC